MRHFMNIFRFDTICNITQEPQELQRFNSTCCFIGKSATIKFHPLLTKNKGINGNCFSTSKQQLLKLLSVAINSQRYSNS